MELYLLGRDLGGRDRDPVANVLKKAGNIDKIIKE